MRRNVLLVALENRFGVARLPIVLNRAGCRVTVLGNPKAMVCSSRFVQRVIPCEINSTALAAALRQHSGSISGPKPWVILTDEISLETAASCRGESWVKDIFPVDPQGPMVDVVLRKTSFMEAAAEAGLPIPPTRICRTVADAQAAARELVFPLFLKRDTDCAGAGVIQVHRPADVAAAFARLSGSNAVLVQQMIHGSLAKVNMIYSHGKPLCWAAAYAHKTWPGKFGPSCVREYLVDPQLEAIVHQLGDLIGFHGLCGFDAIHDEKTGRFIIIEFNGRLTPHYHHDHYVGVDYGRAMADFLDGRLSYQRPRILGGKPPMIYIFPQDLRRCLAEADFKGLLKWLPGMSRKDIPWGDASLILRFMADYAGIVFKKLPEKLRSLDPIAGRSADVQRETPFSPDSANQTGEKTEHELAVGV